MEKLSHGFLNDHQFNNTQVESISRLWQHNRLPRHFLTGSAPDFRIKTIGGSHCDAARGAGGRLPKKPFGHVAQHALLVGELKIHKNALATPDRLRRLLVGQQRLHRFSNFVECPTSALIDAFCAAPSVGYRDTTALCFQYFSRHIRG